MGAGSIATVSGILSFNNARGTLTSSTAGAGSKFIFNSSAAAPVQTLAIPISSPAAWFYFHVWSENTSTTGLQVVNNIDGSITGTLRGDIEVRPNSKLQLASNVRITGNDTRNFVVSSTNGVFEIVSVAGNPVCPTGYTFNLGTVAPFGTVLYNSNAARDIAVQTAAPVPIVYGHLKILNNPVSITANRNYTIPNATLTVNGNLTIGDGVSAFAPNLIGTGAATFLDVKGDINVLGGTLNATFIPAIRVGGNWINNSTFTISTGTVEFNGTGTKTIGGTSASTFYNLIVNTLATTDFVQVTKDVTVNNVLALTQGGLDLVDATNVGRTLTLVNPATTAMTRTGGYIKGERLISSASVPF